MRIERTLHLQWNHDGHGGRGSFEGAGALAPALTRMFARLDSFAPEEGEMPFTLDIMRGVRVGTPCKLTLILEVDA
jgi:hypothetical protein